MMASTFKPSSMKRANRWPWRAGAVAAGLFACAALAACAGHDPAENPSAIATPDTSVKMADAAPGSGDAPQAAADAMPQAERGIGMLVYQDFMPYGATIANDAFWKLLDEESIDPYTRDLLLKNGFRVGKGQIKDWAKFRSTLDNSSAYCGSPGRIFIPPSFKSTPLSLSAEMDEETLWVFNEHGLAGRTYFHCMNRFEVSMQWAPRRQNTVSLTLTPAVFTVRKRMDYFLMAFPPEAASESDESMYDLRLRAEVGEGEFFVVAPGPAARDADRLGSRFLVEQTPADRYESILIFTQAAINFGPALRNSAQHPNGPTTAPSKPATRKSPNK